MYILIREREEVGWGEKWLPAMTFSQRDLLIEGQSRSVVTCDRTIIAILLYCSLTVQIFNKSNTGYVLFLFLLLLRSQNQGFSDESYLLQYLVCFLPTINISGGKKKSLLWRRESSHVSLLPRRVLTRRPARNEDSGCNPTKLQTRSDRKNGLSPSSDPGYLIPCCAFKLMRRRSDGVGSQI